MLWLLYIAWWTDLVGLVPGARPEARLLPRNSHEALNAAQSLPLGLNAAPDPYSDGQAL